MVVKLVRELHHQFKDRVPAAMIETQHVTVSPQMMLSCRVSGPQGAAPIVFLHGFPEAAFVWDPLLQHFGTRYRCIAPNLRGFADSSSPAEVEAYRARHVVDDLCGLIDRCGNGRAAAVVGHDWGGAVAWALAALHPQRLERLVIVNATHPATFLRELRDNPAQQRASAYMHFLCRPDAEALLADDDFARLWAFFAAAGTNDPTRPGGWLDDATKERYRAVWRRGLRGGCNYYRASPLRPPAAPTDPVMTLQLPPDLVDVRVPTRVVWGEDDAALPPALLDGLEHYVADLQVVRVPGATHWIVHEQPERVAQEIERALSVPR